MLFSLTKKWNSDTCYNWKNLKNIMPHEISQPQKDKYKIPLIMRSPMYQIYRDRNSMVVARGWETEKRGIV